jgi:hypothetical protein
VFNTRKKAKAELAAPAADVSVVRMRTTRLPPLDDGRQRLTSSTTSPMKAQAGDTMPMVYVLCLALAPMHATIFRWARASRLSLA